MNLVADIFSTGKGDAFSQGCPCIISVGMDLTEQELCPFKSHLQHLHTALGTKQAPNNVYSVVNHFHFG